MTEAWTGPQVAWTMARGGPAPSAASGSTATPSGSASARAFLLGLVDWRRLLSLRNLDLLALLSFSVSLWFFNRGDIFTAMPLVYPGLRLAARALRSGSAAATGAPRGHDGLAGVGAVAATVFLAGFRVGLNVRASNVIDVGYAGVIGADRIWHGQSPYGNFPVEEDRPKCGPADASGEVRERIQTNGRCETANPRGDTYGPVSYLAYLPGYSVFGWSGKWDTLPAAHATSILLGPALHARARARRPAARRARDSRRRSRSRGWRGRSRSTPRTRTRTT